MQPAAIAEVKRRQKFLRKIHAGEQPSKAPHFTYFRLELIELKDGIYRLTKKAIELYIERDYATMAERLGEEAKAAQSKDGWPFYD